MPVTLDQLEAGGQYIDLPQGKVFYKLFGDEKAKELIVCVHGLGSGHFQWNLMVPVLVAQGYRVLIYDLFGRCLSDDLPGTERYTKEVFVHQIHELLKLSDLASQYPSFGLIGHSMGGFLVQAYACAFPNDVSFLVTFESHL